MQPSPRTAQLVFGIGLAVWIANAAIAWLAAAPLGYDEAQYTLSASDLLAGQESRWYFYISPWVTRLAMPGLWLGGSEVALRLPSFLLGIGFVLGAWAVARRLFGATTAAWTVLVLAGTRSIMKLGVELLSDLPAAACLLFGTAIIAGEVLRDGGPRWRLVLAAPLFAAAMYFRYASCVAIAIAGAAAIVVGGRALIRRPAPAIATAALFCALLVPHALAAKATTGSPFGILLASKAVPRRAWFAEGVATYLTSNPFAFYGAVAAPIFVAGMAALLVRRERRVALLWSIGVGQIVALGLISHAQVRYVAFGVALLLVLGVEIIRGWITARPPRARAALTALAAAAVATAAAMAMISQTRHGAGRRARMTATLDAEAAIRADSRGARCELAGVESPQLEWYTGCRWVYPGSAMTGVVRYFVADPKAPSGPRCRAIARDVVRCAPD